MRLPALEKSPLWLDECASVETAQAVARSSWGIVAGASSRGLSTYFLLLAPWVGEPVVEWAVRLPSALAGIALVPVAWVLGLHVGGRPLAWRLGLAAAASPFFVWHSREARWYTLTWLLAGLGAVGFVRALRGRSFPDLVGCVGFGLAAASTYSPAVMLLAIQLGWIAAARRQEGDREDAPSSARRRRRPGRALLLAVLAAIGFAWLWVALLSPALRGGARGFGFSNLGGPSLGAVLYTPVALATGYTIGPGPLEWHARPVRPPAGLEGAAMFLAVSVMLGLLALGARTLAVTGGRRLAAALLSLGLLPPCGVVLAGLWTDHRFAPRHAGMSFLYLLCVAAAGTMAPGAGRRLGAALGAMLLAAQSFSLFNLHTSARYRREDVRSAAQYVARAAGSADHVLIFGELGLPWKRYYSGEAPWDAIATEGSRRWSREQVVDRARGAREVFVVRGLILGNDDELPLLRAVDEVTEPIETLAFTAIEVSRRRVSPGGVGPEEPTGPCGP